MVSRTQCHQPLCLPLVDSAHRRRASRGCGDLQYHPLLPHFAFCRYRLPPLGRDSLVQHCLLNAQGSVLLPVVLQNGTAELLCEPWELRESNPAPSTPPSSCNPPQQDPVAALGPAASLHYSCCRTNCTFGGSPSLQPFNPVLLQSAPRAKDLCRQAPTGTYRAPMSVSLLTCHVELPA